MARTSQARRTALRVLSERRRRAGRVRELLRASDAMAALDARDKALASRLAFGVVATEGFLDAVIDARVKRPSSLEPRVRDALRLVCFEGLFLDTPKAVTVSQGVELVRSVVPRAAGLANAVLRRVVDDVRPKVDAARERCRTGEASLKDCELASGLPAWILERVAEGRGLDTARAMALCHLEPAPVYVTGNLLRHDATSTSALLSKAGLSPVSTELTGCFELTSPAPLASSGLVDAVDVVVSDMAAQLVAHIVAPREGEHVLEIGQGRGTKSLLLENVSLARGGLALIEGLDVEPYKTKLAERRMEVAGLSDWVRCHAYDACNLANPDLPEPLRGPFDRVFVDAPCSGTGTMRRHPEIAWSLSKDTFTGESSLPSLQLRMLIAAATRVKKDGFLIYATCSVLPEENEQVVDRFLASEQGSHFERVRVCEAAATPESSKLVTDNMTSEGDFQTLPATGSCDGHYCATLVRIS